MSVSAHWMSARDVLMLSETVIKAFNRYRFSNLMVKYVEFDRQETFNICQHWEKNACVRCSLKRSGDWRTDNNIIAITQFESSFIWLVHLRSAQSFDWQQCSPPNYPKFTSQHISIVFRPSVRYFSWKIHFEISAALIDVLIACNVMFHIGK